MTVFLAVVSLFVVARNSIVSDLLQRIVSNDLAEWNPVPSSVLLNSVAKLKSSLIGC